MVASTAEGANHAVLLHRIAIITSLIQAKLEELMTDMRVYFVTIKHINTQNWSEHSGGIKIKCQIQVARL